MYKISSDIVLCAEFATKYMRRYFCAYYWSKLGLGQGEAFRLDEETFKKNGGQVHEESLRLQHSETEVKKVGQVHRERLRPHQQAEPTSGTNERNQ